MSGLDPKKNAASCIRAGIGALMWLMLFGEMNPSHTTPGSEVYAAPSGDFVFRICFTTDREAADVELREVTDRKTMDMCAWVTACSAAEVVVRLNTEAKRSFWRSRSPGECR